MAYGQRVKTEHAGAKNGGGMWCKRNEAKTVSRKIRRRRDREEAAAQMDQT